MNTGSTGVIRSALLNRWGVVVSQGFVGTNQKTTHKQKRVFSGVA